MANRLAEETSPYLLQHAENPVDWYPWGAEALERAKQEDKPILLSIGYAACPWCHVMAHESFEDDETARLMNDRFVNIKVDREAVVHEASGLVVLEGLVRHHVAPVTGGVADAQEDRFVFLLGPLECLSSPRVPINRILGVLEQVRTRFFSEAIRHSWRRWSCPDAPRSSRVDGT